MSPDYILYTISLTHKAFQPVYNLGMHIQHIVFIRFYIVTKKTGGALEKQNVYFFYTSQRQVKADLKEEFHLSIYNVIVFPDYMESIEKKYTSMALGLDRG